MIYIVKYKLKWNSEEKEISYKDKDDILFLISQIQRGIASLDNKLVYWFEELENFQVFFQNYDQINSNGQYLNITIDDDWDPDINECFNPKKKNITNELFVKRKVSSKKNWNISLSDNTIYVLGDSFILKNWSKEREIIELLLNIRREKKSNFIEYTDIEIYFYENEHVFKELTKRDLIKEKIRDTLKNKLAHIKKEIKKDVLKISVRWITFKI